MLNLNYGANTNILPTGALTLNGGSVNIYSSAASPTILADTIASTNLNAGASSISTFTQFAAGSATLQLPGLASLNLGAITRAAGGTSTLFGPSAATTTGNTNGILGTLAYATVGGSSWAVANGGTTAISGLSAYNADTFVANGHTDITVAGANVGGTAATLRFSGANAADITGATTLSMGGILVTSSVGANTSTISGALNATGNELIVHQHNVRGDLVLSNIGGTNTILTTAGRGRTVVTGNIGGSGTSFIGSGYLQLGNGGTAGMVGTGAILNDGTLAINRSNAVTFGTAVISGVGNIEQLGAGTTTLGGANTFQGRVSINGGILEITNNAALGAAATAATNRWANLTSINTGGTLQVNVTAGGNITETLNLSGGTSRSAQRRCHDLGGPSPPHRRQHDSGQQYGCGRQPCHLRRHLQLQAGL